MNPERWEQVRRIFDHLVDKSPSHRTDYLEIVCERDPALRDEVERMLAASDAMGEDESIGLFGRRSTPSHPEKIGEYMIEQPLGEGGMGTVYAARHPRFGRVALKLLPGFLVEDPAAARRFGNEAAVLERLQHPVLCRLCESFVADGYAGIAMELVDGDVLTDLIAGEPLDVGRAARLIRALADGLEVAHRQSVYHRDIKPANIIVARGPAAMPKLIDFGIAKFADVKLTATGQAVGSPRYMSPEQWLGQRVDGRTDLWSLGVLWYEMLTGRRPFEAHGLADIAAAVVKSEYPPLPAVNERGEPLGPSAAIIGQLLRKRPGERIASCAELVRRIDAM